MTTEHFVNIKKKSKKSMEKKSYDDMRSKVYIDGKRLSTIDYTFLRLKQDRATMRCRPLCLNSNTGKFNFNNLIQVLCVSA